MDEVKTEGLPGAGVSVLGKLTGIGGLFGRSWRLYRLRFPVFSLIYLFYLTPLMLISAFCFFVYRISPHPLNPFVTAWIAAGVIIGGLISIWGQAAFIYAVSDPEAGIKRILQKAAESLRKFLWLYLLFFALTIGGFVFFVVPGVVMMVWFSFAVFILAGSGETGINALLESRAYVQGFWWPVFIRLLAVWALSFALGSVPVAGSLFSLFFMPYLVTYTSQLYEELAGLKGTVPKPSAGDRKKWAVIAALGVIIAASTLVYTVRHVDLKALLIEGSGEKTVPVTPKQKIEKIPAPSSVPPGSLRSI